MHLFNKQLFEKIYRNLKHNEHIKILCDMGEFQLMDEEIRNSKGQIVKTIYNIYDTTFDDNLLRIVSNEKENGQPGNIQTNYIPYSKIISITVYSM